MYLMCGIKEKKACKLLVVMQQIRKWILSLTGFSFILMLCASGLCSDIDFSKPAGFVNDFADILSESEENQVTEIAENLKRDTSAEIAIVTVKTIKPYTLEEYSVRLFEKWGIGRKGKDNGILLLVALEERKIKIEVGYGLEGVLTDGLCGEIIRNYVVPEFKSGNYGRGIVDGANRIASVISGKEYYKSSSMPGMKVGEDFVKELNAKFQKYTKIIIIFIFIFAMFLSALFPHRRRRYYHSGGFGSFGGGGFGGFGGGRSGGGGASGGW